MVRAVGLEPTLLSERDFESRASTNFTTPAFFAAVSTIAVCTYVTPSAPSSSWQRFFLPP